MLVKHRIATLLITILFAIYGVSELFRGDVRDGIEALVVGTVFFGTFLVFTKVDARHARKPRS